MALLAILLFCLLTIAAILLYQIALKYNSWITTFSIVLTLGFSIAASVAVYENLGFPKEIHFFEKQWVMLHYEPSDTNNTFYIMILEKESKPRLVAFKISNKEKYEKQKEGLKAASKKSKGGELVAMQYDSETEEFIEHKFNLAEKYQKGTP